MVKFIIAGGMGAIINCALSSAFSLEVFFRDFLVQPLSAFRTLLPAALGFLFGTLLVLVWNFMRAMVIRYLLAYNGWFLNPKQPIIKVTQARSVPPLPYSSSFSRRFGICSW